MKAITRFRSREVSQPGRLRKLSVTDYPDIRTRHTFYRVPPGQSLESALRTVQGYQPGERRFKFHVSDFPPKGQHGSRAFSSTEPFDPRAAGLAREKLFDLLNPSRPERGTGRQRKKRQSPALPIPDSAINAARDAAAVQQTIPAQQLAYIDSLRQSNNGHRIYLDIEVIERWPK